MKKKNLFELLTEYAAAVDAARPEQIEKAAAEKAAAIFPESFRAELEKKIVSVVSAVFETK